MNASHADRKERKKQLLRELTQLEIEELREENVFDRTPHYSQLERAASKLGKLLSRETQ